ncbi:MAG: hypothetical protein PHX80_03840 [Candidatus Nanoarchaeia archaeon]|nr:hypothetical protein [Candidatus Nanoarchaeia archaeon]
MVECINDDLWGGKKYNGYEPGIDISKAIKYGECSKVIGIGKKYMSDNIEHTFITLEDFLYYYDIRYFVKINPFEISDKQIEIVKEKKPERIKQ